MNSAYTQSLSPGYVPFIDSSGGISYLVMGNSSLTQRGNTDVLYLNPNSSVICTKPFTCASMTITSLTVGALQFPINGHTVTLRPDPTEGNDAVITLPNFDTTLAGLDLDNVFTSGSNVFQNGLTIPNALTVNVIQMNGGAILLDTPGITFRAGPTGFFHTAIVGDPAQAVGGQTITLPGLSTQLAGISTDNIFTGQNEFTATVYCDNGISGPNGGTLEFLASDTLFDGPLNAQNYPVSCGGINLGITTGSGQARFFFNGGLNEITLRADPASAAFDRLISLPKTSINDSLVAVTSMDTLQNKVLDGNTLNNFVAGATRYIWPASDATVSGSALVENPGGNLAFVPTGCLASPTLTSAECKTLHSTPVLLLGPPGAGKVILIESVALNLQNGSTPFNNLGNAFVQYGSAYNEGHSASGIIANAAVMGTGSASTNYMFSAPGSTGTDVTGGAWYPTNNPPTSAMINQGIYLACRGADASQGNGQIVLLLKFTLTNLFT